MAGWELNGNAGEWSPVFAANHSPKSTRTMTLQAETGDCLGTDPCENRESRASGQPKGRIPGPTEGEKLNTAPVFFQQPSSLLLYLTSHQPDE